MKEASTLASMNLGGNFHGSLFDMVVQAGLVVQLVLLLLLVFSVISWAIILLKYFSIRKIRSENVIFLSSYMRSTKLSEIFPEAKKYRYSTIAEVFRAGYSELAKITKAGRGNFPGKEAADTSTPVPGNCGHRQCGSGDEQSLRFRIHKTRVGSRLPGYHGERQPFHRPVRNRMGGSWIPSRG